MTTRVENSPEAQRAPAPGAPARSGGWRFSTRGTAFRLFLTCWLIYVLHFATNIVREIYPAVALGDHLSFRLDEYANMHPDIFETEGYGWHQGNNPGASMLAAIPYALSRPIIDPIVESVNRARAASDLTEPPTYDSPWPMAREFYREAWRRGLDVKLVLAAAVTQAFCMAPVSALGVVAMFYLLHTLFKSDRAALWLSLLFAFGTPVFFRTGYLNQNLMLGYFVFMSWITMWNPSNSRRWSTRTRYFLGGLAGGTAVLFDYSGLVLLLGLFIYGLVKRTQEASARDAIRHGAWYIVGSVGPIALLWFYQWQSYGHPFLPGQHWMSPREWMDLGYQGYGLPQLELLFMLILDHRFGLFVLSPLMLLALAAPLVDRGADRLLPKTEMVFILVLFVVFWVFFSGSNYVRLQFNTGIRYMIPMLPFLFVPASVVLVRLPRPVIYFVSVFSVAQSWSLAMHRNVEHSLGMLNPMLQVIVGGFQLPWLTTLSRMGHQFSGFLEFGVSPLPLFALTAAVLFGIWSPYWSVWEKMASLAGNGRSSR